MKQLWLYICVTCMLNTLSCAEDAAAPAAPTNNNNFNATPGFTTPISNCPTPSFNSPITTDTATDSSNQFGSVPDPNANNSTSFDDTNRTFLVDEFNNNTFDNSNNSGSNFGTDSNNSLSPGTNNSGVFGSSSTDCPPASTPIDISQGNESTDNQQINDFINPKEKQDCNSQGKVWHWLKGNAGGECLGNFTRETTWCNSGSYANEFGSNSAAVKAILDPYLSQGYTVSECGKGSSGSVYVSLFKLDNTDTGANLLSKWQCSGNASTCPNPNE